MKMEKRAEGIDEPAGWDPAARGLGAASCSSRHTSDDQPSGVYNERLGLPVTGTIQMTFKIYNVLDGGVHLWTETRTVAVRKGVYNVRPGGTDNMDLAL